MQACKHACKKKQNSRTKRSKYMTRTTASVITIREGEQMMTVTQKQAVAQNDLPAQRIVNVTGAKQTGKQSLQLLDLAASCFDAENRMTRRKGE